RENLRIFYNIDGSLRFLNGRASVFPTRRITDSNRRGDRFRSLNDTVMKDRRRSRSLKTEHRRQTRAFAMFGIIAVSGPVCGDIAGVTNRQKMKIGSVSE